MKILGTIMLVLAIVAAGVGLQKWNDRYLESLQEDVVRSSKKLADFSDASERLMVALGTPTSYESEKHQRNYEKAQEELADRREKREFSAYVAFGISGFFLLLATILFVGASLRQPPAPIGAKP